MKKLIVFLIVFLFIASFVSACAPSSEIPTQETPASTSDPSFYLDSDGDGMNDWFEENVAGYDSTIPNDRYVIIYFCFVHDPGFSGTIADGYYDFFVGEGKVPPENIVLLKKEEANAVNLKKALEEIAKKSDKNDIVFLYLVGHGASDGIEMNVEYVILDEWLDQIEAKVVIVQIMACGCEAALPILKEGSCPRIVFVYSAGEFIGGLGKDPEYFTTADTKYGNGNGYVSIGEIANWLDNDPFWGGDWGVKYKTYEELYKYGRSFYETEGYSHMSDTSNVALETYLTDCYYEPHSAKNS